MYAKIINGIVDESTLSHNIRYVEPNISFPEVIDNNDLPEGLVYIVESGMPEYDESFQKIERNPIQEINGILTISYKIVELSDSEKEIARLDKEIAVRSERDGKLVSSDWTQGKDIVDSVSTPWAVYRQKLRDISKQEEFPWNVQWPKEPY